MARFDDVERAEYVAGELTAEFDAPFEAFTHGDHWHVAERADPATPPRRVGPSLARIEHLRDA